MQVVVLTLIAIVLYSGFGILTAQASTRLNSNLVAAIGNAIGMAIPLVVFYIAQAKKQVITTKEGIIYAVLAGVLIAGFSMLLTYIFSRSENISFVMPVVYGGTIIVTTLAGIVLFKEHLSAIGIIGVALVAVGITCLVYARLHA